MGRAALLLALVASWPGAPVAEAQATARATVVHPAANMFSRPSLEADVVSQAPYASAVAILQVDGGWARVKTSDEYEGWVVLDDLRWLRDGEPSYGEAGTVVYVTSLFANVYREPNVTKHKPLVTVPIGTVLERRAEPVAAGTTGAEATPVSAAPDERWMLVMLPDRRPGWIQRGDVSSEWPRLDVPGVIAFAKRFLGVPYLWGGTTALGLDCSGFMQALMRRRGVTLPRDAGPQSRWEATQPVACADAQAGDLLYFGEVATKITHTGMAIGDGEFIHATANTVPVVQISRLDREPWATLLKACRRLR